MRHAAYRHFNLPPDPFVGHIPTGDSRRIGIAVAAAVATGAMISISGERGSGKTHALWHALESQECSIIEPLRLDRERMHIGDIQSAIITQLSDEKPRHGGEGRAGQTRRLLRAASRPVLVIDEAHLLHGQTLRALKRLRELGVRGGGGAMLPVILVGQSDPTARIPEVGLRTDSVTLAGLTQTEAEQITRQAIGSIAEPDAVKQLAASPAARNHLELRRLIDDTLATAVASGANRITTLGQLDPAPADTELAPAPGCVAAALNRGGSDRKEVAA